MSFGEWTRDSSSWRDLRKGYILSCGCHKAQRLREALTTHGLSHMPIYGRWSGMIQRCSDPNHIGYDRYGAKGITVCDRWLSFENFYADMGEPPTEQHSVERRDGSLGYFKDNCYWATRSQQKLAIQARIISSPFAEKLNALPLGHPKLESSTPSSTAASRDTAGQ